MIHVIPSIDLTSTCLHAENPQATAMVLKWRTFQKLILLPGPEKNLRAAAKKSATLVLAEFATFYAKREGPQNCI